MTMIGQTVSHYTILEKLGEGGMGVVYKARDENLERFVALKFLPARLEATAQDKARFSQEAKAASSLNHPNVCTIHDIQDHDGRTFIVMEYVEGATLREKSGTVSFKQAVDIGIQLADGLAAAHEKGIVHRDIKPENIMVRKDGLVQIMDFGLAKLRGVSTLTAAGSTIGTAGYMSPEQVQGMEADHRSDIFSLGAVLYELFTGSLPFKGVHETALMYEIVNVDPVPMAAVKPEIDPQMDAIVLECLAKEPSERYQSVAEVAKELRRFKRESTRVRASRTVAVPRFSKVSTERPAAGPAAARSRSRFVWPVVAAVLLVAAAFFAWRTFHKDPAGVRPVMRFSIDLPQSTPLHGGESGLAVSPDGKYLAYLGDIPNAQQIYLRPMNEFKAQPIPGTEGALELSFSPDGQWIVYSAREKLLKVSIFGGASEEICPTQGQTRGIWWAADGSILFGHISRSIYRVPAGGGTPQAVTTLDSSAGEISHRFPQSLPDGKTVIFTIKQNNIASFDEAVIAGERIGGGERKILIRGGTYGRYVPTGYLIYVSGKTIFAVPFDPERLEVKGNPVPVEEGGWLNRGSGQANLSFSNTGALVFAPLGPVDFENVVMRWMDRNGGTQPLLDTARSYYSASFSPDGGKLAVDIQAANNDIWIYQIARGTLTRLTFGGGNNDFPLWSPDGRYVVYQAEKGKSPNIFRKPWDGSGAEERLTNDASTQTPTSFTPDGKMLAYTQNGDIWVLPLEGDRKPWPLVQSPANESRAMFSPDGRFAAYTSDESGKNEVYVIPFPKHDSKWQISTGGGSTVLWSGSGKELFYLNGSTMMVVDVSPGSKTDFSVPRKLCDLPQSTVPYDVSPDGRRFAVGLARAQRFTLNQVDVVLEWFDELRQKFTGKD